MIVSPDRSNAAAVAERAGTRIRGSGEMANLIRAKDWSETSLGPVEGWSETLVATLNVMLLSPISYALYWGDDRLLLYNDLYRECLGEKHPGALGKAGPEVWAEAWATIGGAIDAAYEGTVTEAAEVFIPIVLGGALQDRWWTYALYPVYDGCRVRGVANPGSDETPRLLAVRALEESRLEAESLLAAQLLASRERQVLHERVELALSAAAGVGIWDWDVRADLVYTDANFAAVYGVDPEDGARGITIAAFTANMHPDDVARVGAQIEAAVTTGGDYASEYRLLQRDGTVRWVFAKGRCSYDEMGKPLRFPGVSVDITDRVETERALRVSEERLRIALETARLGSWDEDFGTGMIELSRVCLAIYGRDGDGRMDRELMLACVHPDDRAMIDTAVSAAIAARRPYRCEYRVLWPDESVHWVVANGRVRYDAAGEAEGMTGVSMDVTERHLAQAALLQNEKLAAVGRLASTISHEINNPLESVTNLLYLARMGGDAAVLDGYLESAERELRRVSVITNQTLRFYKQRTGRTSIQCVDLFAETLSIYQGRLLNSNVTVEKRKWATRPAVCLEGEIRQVLSNLIGNAIDSMQAGGGRLLLRSRETTNRRTGQAGLALTVADTGVGMSATVRAKVFDAFFSTKGLNGTGLGLWVSREIVDRHEGTLRVRSSQRTAAHGTVFVLFLPFELTERKPAAKA